MVMIINHQIDVALLNSPMLFHFSYLRYEEKPIL